MTSETENEHYKVTIKACKVNMTTRQSLKNRSMGPALIGCTDYDNVM